MVLYFIVDIFEILKDYFVKKNGNVFFFYYDFVREVIIFVFGIDYLKFVISYVDIRFLSKGVRIGSEYILND